MIKNKYPLLLISKLFSQLQNTKYFTKLDICWSFNNVQIKFGDKQKIAFHTNHRLCELLVMFFNMTNSPVIFQTMMNNIFQDLIVEDIIIVYLNDILIYTQTLEEYYRTVARVLKVLIEHKLYLQPKKYNKQQIEYLGLVISKNQVEMDLIKVARICDWPISKIYTDLQAFLSFTNFYQRFIYRFSKVAYFFFDFTGSNSIWT